MHDGHESGGAANEMKREEENLVVKGSSLSDCVKMEFISETSSCAIDEQQSQQQQQQQQQVQVQESTNLKSPKTEAIQKQQQQQMCAGCRAPIRDKFLFSVIDLLWHANCVQCCVCSRQLNDRCFTYENKLYCSHDYWRRFGPKCYACREPIEKSELVQRIKGSRVYHLKCFTCAHCKRRLEQGEQLHLIDNEQRLLCKQDFVQHVARSSARPSKPMVRSDSGVFSLTLLNSPTESQAAAQLSAKKQLNKRSSLTALDNMLGARRRAEGDELEEDEDEEQDDEEEEEEEDNVDGDDDDDELNEDELTRELDADELAASCFEEGQNDENNHAKRQSSLGASAINQSAGAINNCGGVSTKKRRRRRRLDASASSPLVASGKRAKRNGESILNASSAQQQQQQQQSASSILANMKPTSGSSSSPSSTSSSSSSSASNHSTASSNSTSALHSHHPHHHHHAHQQHPHHAHSSVVSTNQQQAQQQQQQQQQQLTSGANHQTSAAGGGHKPTRVRTVLNEKQLQTLRDCYAHNPRPDALMKEQLVDMTGLSPRVIRVWFQNKRCKDKKKSILYKQMQQHEKDGRHLAGLTHIRGVSMVASSPIQFGDEAPIAELQAEVVTSPTQQQQSVQSPNSKATTTTTNATTAQNNSPALDIHAYQPPWKGLVEYAKDSTIGQQQQQQQQQQPQQPDPSSPRYQQLIGQIHGYQTTTTTANEHQEAHQVIEQQQQQQQPQPQFPANNYQMAPPAPAHLHHLHHAHPVTQPQPPPPLPIGHHQLHQFQPN